VDIQLALAPTRLPLSDVDWRGVRLMMHQARALELAGERRVLIEAPTGGGKTWTGAAPLVDGLDRGEGAVFVYPTNALADDQCSSLLDLARRAGKPAAEVLPDGTLDGDPGAHVMLWRVHACTLEEARTEVGGKRRGDTFAKVLERLPARPLWLVTNPDTLYLLCIARYAGSPQIWSRLDGCKTLVLDEFHLYRGPTLVRALVLLELARVLIGLDRTRVLSATLPANLRKMLEERFGFVQVSASPSSNGRVVQHSTVLSLVSKAPRERTDALAACILPQIETLRTERNTSVPMVVLRQSVIAAIHLEDVLAANKVQHAEIGVYRGLSSKAVRSMKDKTLVLGTSALEVGVDFRTRRLLFEAASATSFAQRLGRVGRHEPGTAVFFTDHRVANALSRFAPACDRDTLLATASVVLEADDDLTDQFALSPWGGAVRSAALMALRKRGRKMGAGGAFEDRMTKAEGRLDAALGKATRPGLLSRAAQARLAEESGFRGGAGSVEVFDVREEHRRGDAKLAVYEIDLASFYARAQWQGAPPARTRPVITGYAKPRRLGLTLAGTTAVEVHAPHKDAIELRVDNEATAWEVLLRERDHLVGLFPRSLRERLSWRETVFDSLDDRIALLDDDALIAGFFYAPDGNPR
jgi:CRISPR-associated helicase Cas3